MTLQLTNSQISVNTNTPGHAGTYSILVSTTLLSDGQTAQGTYNVIVSYTAVSNTAPYLKLDDANQVELVKVKIMVGSDYSYSLP